MADLIAFASSNFDGTSWLKNYATGTNASMTTVSSSTNTTTSYVDSSAFTVSTSQTLEGLLLYCKRLNTTGTVSVALSDNNGTTATREVTVNASDLPDQVSWVFFKFGSTLASDGGNDYKVKVKSSSADNAVFYRDATAGNWARRIRTSTETSLYSSADTIDICGELTGAGTYNAIDITIAGNYAANPAGLINCYHRGTLKYATTASTTFNFQSQTVTCWGGGTFTIGTTAAPIPRTSTAIFNTSTGLAVDVKDGGVFNSCGESRSSGKDIYYCLLNTDEAVNSTSLGVDTDTGWLDNDEIVVAPTGTTTTQHERGFLNGNATSTTLTVDGFAGTGGGLAFAHSGTAPFQAEVMLMTRNVTISNASPATAVHVKVSGATGVLDCRWTAFPQWGHSGSFYLSETTTGSCLFKYCSFRLNATSYVPLSLSLATIDNVTLQNNCIYSSNLTSSGTAFQLGGPGTTNTKQNNLIDGNIIITPGSQSAWGIYADWITFTNNRMSAALTLSFVGGTGFGVFTGNHFRSMQSTGFTAQGMGNFSGSIIHCNMNNTSTLGGMVITNGSWTIGSTNFAGNNRQNLLASNGTVEVNDSYFAATTSISTPLGLTVSFGQAILNNCEFRTSTGAYAAHATADISNARWSQIILRKTKLGATTEFSTTSSLTQRAYLANQDYDGTVGSHKTWKFGGTVTNDTTIYKTASPSERLTPTSASLKLSSATKLVAVDSGTTKSVKVWVRESVAGDGTDYNGNRVRLICRRSDGAGVTSDSVLATATSSSEGAWQQLTGTTPAITADAVLELYVDCDGTTGWVNVDDWTVS